MYLIGESKRFVEKHVVRRFSILTARELRCANYFETGLAMKDIKREFNHSLKIVA